MLPRPRKQVLVVQAVVAAVAVVVAAVVVVDVQVMVEVVVVETVMMIAVRVMRLNKVVTRKLDVRKTRRKTRRETRESLMMRDPPSLMKLPKTIVIGFHLRKWCT